MTRANSGTGCKPSKAAASANEVLCRFAYRARVPIPIRSQGGPDQLNFNQEVSAYSISGEFGAATLDLAKWTAPPHQALANLPLTVFKGGPLGPGGDDLIDKAAAEAFTIQYGVLGFPADGEIISTSDEKIADSSLREYGALDSLSDNDIDSIDKSRKAAIVRQYAFLKSRPHENNVAGTRFTVTSTELVEAQSLLRRGWEGNPDAIAGIRKDAVRNLVLQTPGASDQAVGGHFELTAKNLWTLICLLFLKDYGLGKLGRCANPECQAYFIKPRRTQTVCERQVCLHWAQKQFSLDWWNRHGRAKRARNAKSRSSSKEKKTK